MGLIYIYILKPFEKKNDTPNKIWRKIQLMLLSIVGIKPAECNRKYFSRHPELIMNKIVCTLHRIRQCQVKFKNRCAAREFELNVTRAYSMKHKAWTMKQEHWNTGTRYPTECVFSTIYLTQRLATRNFSTLFAMVAFVSGTVRVFVSCDSKWFYKFYVERYFFLLLINRCLVWNIILCKCINLCFILESKRIDMKSDRKSTKIAWDKNQLFN